MAAPANVEAVLAASEAAELVIDQGVLGALSSIPGLYDGAGGRKAGNVGEPKAQPARDREGEGV